METKGRGSEATQESPTRKDKRARQQAPKSGDKRARQREQRKDTKKWRQKGAATRATRSPKKWRQRGAAARVTSRTQEVETKGRGSEASAPNLGHRFAPVARRRRANVGRAKTAAWRTSALLLLLLAFPSQGKMPGRLDGLNKGGGKCASDIICAGPMDHRCEPPVRVDTSGGSPGRSCEV